MWAIVSFWGGTAAQKVDIVRASVNTMIANESGDIDVNIGGSVRSNEPSRGASVFWILGFRSPGFRCAAWPITKSGIRWSC